MKLSTSRFSTDRDSQTPKLAAQDWERREAQAAGQEAAEIRQENLLQAIELAPPFQLHRLPQNFWVAVIPTEEISERQKGVLPLGGDAQRAELAQPPPQDLLTSTARDVQPPPFWGGSGWGSQITGCTDLFPITDHILFFRSNLSEAEIRDNIDLSFLPF